MERYVTWSDLIQLIIALASIGNLIVSLLHNNNKRK